MWPVSGYRPLALAPLTSYVAGSYDGNNVRLYVNGRLDDENQVGSFGILVDTNDLSIGNRADADVRPFIGAVDDARIYGEALSAANIAYIGLGPSGYSPIVANSNIYDKEAPEHKAVNFKDFALLMTKWLEKKLWPE